MKRFAVLSLLFSATAFAMGVQHRGASSQPTGPQSCQQASECKGVLNHLCKKCPEGEHGGCTHWKCEANQCLPVNCEKD